MFDKVKEKMAGVLGTAKAKLAVTTVSLVGLVQYASAATLNESISPILTSVTELFSKWRSVLTCADVPLLALIIAAVPLIIALAVIGFILGILSAILGKLNIWSHKD
jgi:hypothetical protein